ncbi:hypothetical protein CPB86DRAFT_132780 [Serendipita vermifera]|nr:hypothetical protein CPB86DRAFT_132780 [Serendipita vermifera]
MKLTISAILCVALFSSGAHACYATCTSSTTGKFSIIHSEPKDHGGAAQYMNFSHGSCKGRAQIRDGCSVSVSNLSGCGSVSCHACPSERAC